MQETISRVYCKNCKWLVGNWGGEWVENSWSICNYPLNSKTLWHTDYYSKTKEKYILNSECELNRNNACSWYKRKWWKFWVKQ